MTEFVFLSSESQNAEEAVPGGVAHLTFPISSFGNVDMSLIESVEITIFRWEDDGSRTIVDDADGNTMNSVDVTETIDPAGIESDVYRFTYDVPDDIQSGMHIAEWLIQLGQPFGDQVAYDRLKISGEQTQLSFGD